ncbi:unnamed protein product [Cylicocyclus nassatus]|uniref:Uncharacterized protein n=1 Tax=Cylicocyclus nassatus TaxID=53992 RepID=A0AA36GR06_CYLNA|nr:unnamed protein product [Cylicocyclus nassatus]
MAKAEGFIHSSLYPLSGIIGMSRLFFFLLNVLAVIVKADSEVNIDDLLSRCPIMKAFTSVFSLTVSELKEFKTLMSQVSTLGVEDEAQFYIIFTRLLEESPVSYRKLERYQETSSRLSKLSRKFVNQVFLECLNLVGVTTPSDLKNAGKAAKMRLREKFSHLGRKSKKELRREVPKLLAVLR